MSKGFVIVAQNTDSVNYIECAEQLCNSIKQHMPNSNVTILDLPDLAPNSDWKLINDWQVYQASPYDETIKIEADMIITSNIDYWFDVLSLKDVAVCQTIRDYKGKISNVKVYRNFIYDNKLPDVYNALTYFKKSVIAEKFFSIVRDVFENWDNYKSQFKCSQNEIVTTDWAYSIACHILGTENTTIPNFTDFSMVHMKQFIMDTNTEDWTNELVYEFGSTLKIQTIPQRYPFHYHVKGFSKRLKEHYGRIQTIL